MGHFSIKSKVGFSFIGLILIALLAGLYNLSVVDKLQQVNEIKTSIGEVVRLLSDARKAEKDFVLYDAKSVIFLETKSSNAVEKHAYYISKIDDQLRKLAKNELAKSLAIEVELQSILFEISSYRIAFQELIDLWYIRGFKDHGLEGEMRAFVHALQECETAEEKVFAYSLRRHEKDFVLRKDLSYQKKLHQTAREFIDFVESNKSFDAAYKRKTINNILAYTNHFDKIVDVEKKIGLSQESGISAKLLAGAAAVEPKVDSLYQEISNTQERLYNNSVLVFALLLFLLIAIGVLLNRFISTTVSKRIRRLDNLTRAVVEGDNEVADKIGEMVSKDELGSLARHFQMMLQQLNEQIKLTNNKNAALEQTAEEEKRRAWHIEGLARFSDMMKINNLDLQVMTQHIIAELVNYLQINQGAFFIKEINGENEKMLLSASYAYNKLKYQDAQIAKGDGLIGQAWQERDSLYLTDIPDNYIRITSGLGDATPSALLIVPIMADDEVEGVLELAAFNTIEPYKINFVKELAEKLAFLINSVKMHHKTSVLLENSQQMTEELRAQEEEMRQNMEELQATQEEMQRNARELTAKIDDLDTQSQVFQALISKVYEGIIILDEYFQINYANESIVSLLNYRLGDILNKPIEEFISTEISEVMTQIEQEPSTIITGFSERKDIMMYHASGRKVEVKAVFTRFKTKHQSKTYNVILINSAKSGKDRNRLHRLLSN